MRIPPEVKPLLRAGLVSLLVFGIGMVGYAILAGDRYGIVDIAYMTVITLTTVGFGEVIDLSGSPAGRIFTMVLILGGVGSILYLLSSLAAFFSDGNIQRLMWVRSMARGARAMNDHIIVCGGGTIGTQVLDELHTTGRRFVLIERDEERVRELHERIGTSFPAILGDATDDDRLREAGIDTASGVIACLHADNENLIVVVSARMLRPDVRIVTRCTNMALSHKLRRAGADSVVSPNTIGGMRLSSEMIRPQVVSFLDHMLHDRDQPLRFEEWPIEDDSRFAGAEVREIRALDLHGFLLVALANSDDHWEFNPPDDRSIAAGTRLIFMSSPEAYGRFAELAG